jgi:hypothetical protein
MIHTNQHYDVNRDMIFMEELEKGDRWGEEVESGQCTLVDSR